MVQLSMLCPEKIEKERKKERLLPESMPLYYRCYGVQKTNKRTHIIRYYKTIPL